MCKRVKRPSHTTHPQKRTTQLDRGRPRFSTSGWEGEREKHQAEKWIRRVAPSRATEGKGVKEVARKGLTRSVGQQLPP